MISNADAEIKTIVLATGDWEPYTSSTMESKGAFTEIVTAVFHEMKMEPRYEFYPWKRAETVVQKGQVFAAFPYLMNDERKQIYNFSDTIMNGKGCFFYYKKYTQHEPKYQELSDLSAIKIGGVLGYWYETSFKKAKLNVEYVSSDDMNLKKLYANRVQLIACDELVGWALIEKNYSKEVAQFGTLKKPLNQDEYRLMISKTYPNASEITKSFNAALQKLKKSGKINSILEKYHIKE
jgi:polar amino acid transport system substrate-binding protein